MRYYNQNQLLQYLKKQNKYMSAKEIAHSLKATQQTINRKLKKLSKRTVEKKVRKVRMGKQNRRVSYYRYKK